MKNQLLNVQSLSSKLLIIVVIASLIGSPISGFIQVLLKDQSWINGWTLATITFLVNLLVIPVLVLISTRFLITKRIDKINNVLEDIDVGNYSLQINDRWNDEISTVFKNLEQVAANLGSTQKQLETQKDKVVHQSGYLDTAFDDMQKQNNMQTSAVQKFKQTNLEIINVIEETDTRMSEMVNAMGTTAKQTEILNDKSIQTQEQAEIIKQILEELKQQMYAILTSSQEAVKIIANLDEKSHNISEVTTLIEEIAQKTTILALNASIEAARAGEQGRGFAVVAKEVGKLAENSLDATSQINEMADDIQSVVKSVVENINKNNTSINNGIGNFDNAYTSISNIFTYFTSINDQIQETAAIMEELMASSETISASMATITDMTQVNEELVQQNVTLQSEMDFKINQGKKEIDNLKTHMSISQK